jgi:glycosyltransferase involved in cell wall biosynthesis
VLVSRELGGAGLIAVHVARHLRERGRDCRAWVPGPGPAWDEATRNGVPCEAYDAARALGAARLPALSANWRFGRQLRASGAGVVHVHSPLQYGALRWGLRFAGTARVVHVHLDEDEEGLRWAFRSPPELVVTCARFLVEQARRALPPRALGKTRVVAVPNAVDTDKFAPGPKEAAREKVGAPHGRPLALMLANLSPHKGQETAIRAVALLKQRGVALTLWLAGIERGGGTYTDRLRRLIAEAQVQDCVELLGQRGDAPDLLRAADFFLLPSTREGLPLSVLEAQATRVPVLAAPTAGVPEVVEDGATGFLVAADDAAGYAHRMEQLLAAPRLYQEIADGAFTRTTRQHNWSAYCRRVVDLYDELLESRAARPQRWFPFRRIPAGAASG